MASEVSIANAALQHVKVSKRISSLTQGTKEADVIEEVFAEVRDQLLDRHNWNFAMKRVKLARLAATPVFGFKYEYQLPGDLIRVTAAYDNSGGRGTVITRIEDGKLLADAGNIFIAYVSREGDPNKMPPTFRAALAKQLGARIAVALANSSSLRQGLNDEFESIDLPVAKSVDALQDTPRMLPESSWVSVRGGVDDFDPAVS